MLKINDNPRIYVLSRTIVIDGALPPVFLVVINGVIQHPADFDWFYNSVKNETSILVKTEFDTKSKIQIIWV